MFTHFTSPPLLASIRAALDQPFFPGKILIWLLLMLSIVSWVMILSKFAQLKKVKRADRDFTERLRKSKTTLEVFEEGWEGDASLKHLVYQAGARETAYQLLGSREPQDQMQRRIRDAGKLAGRQLDFLRLAFQTGFRVASARLRAGIEGLGLLALGASLLGGFGFVWTLMGGFDRATDFADIAPVVGASLGYLALGLLVAGPALLARIGLRALVRRRKEEILRFRDDIRRLFERSFAASFEPVRTAVPETSPPRSEPMTDPEVRGTFFMARAEGPSGAGSGGAVTDRAETEPAERKRYHSIRDRLLRPEEEEPDPFEVNPIARQAATLRGY